MILAIKHRMPELTRNLVGELMHLRPSFEEMGVTNVTLFLSSRIDKDVLFDGLAKDKELFRILTVPGECESDSVDKQYVLTCMDDNSFVGALWQSANDLANWIITARERLKVETATGMVHLVRAPDVWPKLSRPEQYLGLLVYRAYQSAGLAPEKDVASGVYVYDIDKLSMVEDTDNRRATLLKSGEFGVWGTIVNHLGVRGVMGGRLLGIQAVKDETCWRWAMQEVIDWMTMAGVLLEDDLLKQATRDEITGLVKTTFEVLHQGLPDKESGQEWHKALRTQGFLERWGLAHKERSAV